MVNVDFFTVDDQVASPYCLRPRRTSTLSIAKSQLFIIDGQVAILYDRLPSRDSVLSQVLAVDGQVARANFSCRPKRGIGCSYIMCSGNVLIVDIMWDYVWDSVWDSVGFCGILYGILWDSVGFWGFTPGHLACMG